MGEGVVGIYIYMGVCMGYRGVLYIIYIIYRGVCIGVGGVYYIQVCIWVWMGVGYGCSGGVLYRL